MTHAQSEISQLICHEKSPLALGSATRETSCRHVIVNSVEEKKFTFLQCFALNTLNMFGTGPFISLPLLLLAAKPHGPQALVGYLVAFVICFCDSLIWAELGAMMPTSGGTYTYLRQTFGRDTFGRLMSFLFVWQFMISGPLEVASGLVACAHYLRYVTGIDNYWASSFTGMFLGFVVVALLYRDTSSVGTITVALWLATTVAVAFTIITGSLNFSSENLTHLPENAFGTDFFITTLGATAKFGLYDLGGYYDAMWIGDEVQRPSQTLPRAVIATCVTVGLVMIAIDLVILGSVPWDGADGIIEKYQNGTDVMALFCETHVNETFASVFVVLVVVTIFGSCFSLVLGYAAIPCVAAKDGVFFTWFAHESEHAEGLADRSLVVFGIISSLCCFLPLENLIESMLMTRILVQFVAQAVAVIYYRRVQPLAARPFKVPLYPLPNIICICGFLFVFFATTWWVTCASLGFLFLGFVVFMTMARVREEWPFAP